MIHASNGVVEPGDALVVTTTAESEDGMFGKLLGESCAQGLTVTVAVMGERRRAKEQRLREGEKGLDLYGLRARLKELGVEYAGRGELWVRL